MGKINRQIHPRDFRLLDAVTMEVFISQNYDDFLRAHTVHRREVAKLSYAMITCTQALNENKNEMAKIQFSRAQAALEKSKSLDASIKKLFLIHKYAVKIYNDMPDRQIGSGIWFLK